MWQKKRNVWLMMRNFFINSHIAYQFVTFNLQYNILMFSRYKVYHVHHFMLTILQVFGHKTLKFHSEAINWNLMMALEE